MLSAVSDSHGFQIFAVPHKFVLFEEAGWHHEIGELSNGSLDVLLPAAQDENSVTGQQQIHVERLELADIAAVIRETAAFQVQQSDFARLKHYIAGDEAAAAVIFEQEAGGILGVTSRCDDAQLEVADGDAVAVAESPIGRARLRKKARGIAAESNVGLNRGVLVDLDHAARAQLRCPDARACAAAYAGGASPMAGVRVSDDDMGQLLGPKAIGRDIGEDVLVAEAQAGVYQGKFLTAVNQVAVAVEGVAQAELLAAHQINVRTDFHDVSKPL